MTSPGVDEEHVLFITRVVCILLVPFCVYTVHCKYRNGLYAHFGI